MPGADEAVPGRATVIRADGTLLANVLDLLSSNDAARVAAEARRVLCHGGLPAAGNRSRKRIG